MLQEESFLRPINELPGIRAAWMERVPGVPIEGGRDEAMRILRPVHERAVHAFAGGTAGWWRAEQVHGNRVSVVPATATIDAPDGLPVVPGVDGLVTGSAGSVLAIYVADCGPIWLADPVRRVVGLLHSGKKGTEQNILEEGLRVMRTNFDTKPEDVVAVLGPCIRPPDYEVDFAATIAGQAAEAGIRSYVDCALNTAEDPRRFYSYRRELGTTGRMLALIQLDPPS